MKILITGSKGFIGKHLMEVFPDAYEYDLKDGNDVLDKENFLPYLNQADVIIHLAAFVSVEESRRNPRKYLFNNIIGTESVIENAIKSGVKKIIYASSAACYDPASSAYALSKYASELLMLSYKDMIHTTSLRFFNLYGYGQNPNYGAAISAFKTGIESNDGEITIYGDGEQTRDFIAVEDVCQAIKLAVNADIPSGMVMDIGTGKETSILQLASVMGDVIGKKPKVTFEPERKGVKYSCANTQKAKELLDFEAEIDLKTGLKSLLK